MTLNIDIRRTKRAFAVAPAIALCCATQAPPLAAQATAVTTPSMRDGSHDLDFDVGTWHADIVRYPEPFLDSGKTARLAGTITVHSIWHGKAELEEIEVALPNGNWEAASLYLYDPIGHQWSRNYVNAEVGRLDGSPKIGGFRNGELALYSQDRFEGRSILVREIFYGIKPDAHDYEEDYSADGGHLWRPAFKAHMSRIVR